jgi:hypothetical protein
MLFFVSDFAMDASPKGAPVAAGTNFATSHDAASHASRFHVPIDERRRQLSDIMDHSSGSARGRMEVASIDSINPSMQIT